MDVNNYIFEQAEILKSLKEKKKALESEVKEINGEIDKTERTLVEAMLGEECESFKLNGFTFYLKTRLFASPQGDSKAELITALKDNGYGDIVTETVNANTLSSFVSEQMSLNNDEIPGWLNCVISTYDKTTVGIRKGN